MHWIGLPWQHQDMTRWSLRPSDGEAPLPPKEELERILRKHEPRAVVDSVVFNTATVQLPVSLDSATRAIMSYDIRTRAQALA